MEGFLFGIFYAAKRELRLLFYGAILYAVKPANYYLTPVSLATKECRGCL